MNKLEKVFIKLIKNAVKVQKECYIIFNELVLFYEYVLKKYPIFIKNITDTRERNHKK